MALVIPFVIAFIVSLALTPAGTRLAWNIGYLDHPEARKLHTSATALLGGAVVFVSALIAWLVLTSIAHPDTGRLALGVIAGGILSLAIGLWDDRFGMQPLLKLGGQGLAAAALLGSGLTPDLGLPTPVAFAITLVALVALMNAVNFLDNMNGMVGGLAAILLIGFAWTSAARGATALAAGQLAIAGACLGFLRYNFPRARIFLGDAGSLFLGYSLGASALLAFEAAPPGWGRLGALLMLAYPAFDLFFVVVNRIREGRKVYEGGKDHSNHRLASVLQCQKTTVIFLWLSGAALAVSGLAVLKLNHPVPALLLSGLWISLFLLAGRRLSSVPVVRAPRPQPTSPSRPR
jgi:UDP-GlcNAc:undecaprenyl-phosphate GlcNAc-1-phosphate transferase